MSEDTAPRSGEAWGNFPQTYSMVGYHQRRHAACRVLGRRSYEQARRRFKPRRRSRKPAPSPAASPSPSLRCCEETGGLWFGWDGNIVEDDADRTPNIVQHNSATVATIPLSRNEYETYYLGYSNKVLWPSFHYRLGLLDYESSFIEGYRARQRA